MVVTRGDVLARYAQAGPEDILVIGVEYPDRSLDERACRGLKCLAPGRSVSAGLRVTPRTFSVESLGPSRATCRAALVPNPSQCASRRSWSASTPIAGQNSDICCSSGCWAG